MASRDVELPVADVFAELDMRVVLTGVRWWGLRMRVARALLDLAGFCAGCHVDVSFAKNMRETHTTECEPR